MPTQNGIESKLDFLVQDAKDAKIESDGLDKERTAVMVICGAICIILLILIAGLVGYKVGYDAGVTDFSQKLILEKMGIIA